jgi:transposase-like protein
MSTLSFRKRKERRMDGHHYRSYQKYFCRKCRKSFNDKTGTIFHYSHAPLKAWFLVLYLYFVLWRGCSTREISLETSIPYCRCYRFIRAIMEKLSSPLSTTNNVKLKGTIEVEEFYIKI